MVSISLEDIARDPRTFLDRIVGGEELLIVQDDRPVAEVKAVAPLNSGLRPFGLCAGEFVVPGDFDGPLPDDVLAAFEAA